MTALVTTEADRDALPVGHVVLSAAGSIACRASETLGVILGDSRTFPWTLLQLPLTILHPAPPVSAETLAAVLELRGVLVGDGVLFGCPWCADSWEDEATCEHAAAIRAHDANTTAEALRDAAANAWTAGTIGLQAAVARWLEARADDLAPTRPGEPRP